VNLVEGKTIYKGEIGLFLYESEKTEILGLFLNRDYQKNPFVKLLLLRLTDGRDRTENRKIKENKQFIVALIN